MVRGILNCGLAAALFLPMTSAFMTTCHAQQMNRSSGSTTGGSSAPRASQASGFGGSSMPGMGGGGGSTQSAAGTGFGSTPLTGIGAGLSAFGQQGTGTGGFVGQNFGATNFVGQANAANGQGQNQRGNQNNQRGGVDRAIQQQLNGGGFGGQNNFGGQNGGGASQQIVIRPQQRIAFDFPKPVANQIILNTQARFNKLAYKQPALAGVQIAMNADGVAVLTGNVVSEDQRRLAEQLVRLEPGVRNVQNNLATTAP